MRKPSRKRGTWSGGPCRRREACGQVKGVGLCPVSRPAVTRPYTGSLRLGQSVRCPLHCLLATECWVALGWLLSQMKLVTGEGEGGDLGRVAASPGPCAGSASALH